jgi:hypothetical protein
MKFDDERYSLNQLNLFSNGMMMQFILTYFRMLWPAKAFERPSSSTATTSTTPNGKMQKETLGGSILTFSIFVLNE